MTAPPPAGVCPACRRTPTDAPPPPGVRVLVGTWGRTVVVEPPTPPHCATP